MFNVGDYVTRNSYNNDIVFKIIAIDKDIYYLKGASVRLYADCFIDDLSLCDGEKVNDKFMPSIDEYRNLNRSEYFYLPGRILHIDADIHLNNKVANPYKIRKNTKLNIHKKSKKNHKF